MSALLQDYSICGMYIQYIYIYKDMDNLNKGGLAHTCPNYQFSNLEETMNIQREYTLQCPGALTL